LAEAKLSAGTLQRLSRGPVLLELSNFDRELLLAIDSQVELRCPLEREIAPSTGSTVPFAIHATRLKFTVSELAVYRDIYYTPQAEGLPPAEERVTLGDDAYYLLGDNSPISVDSRSWGGVPGRLLLGRLWGVR
jgi:hypothetical protein